MSKIMHARHQNIVSKHIDVTLIADRFKKEVPELQGVYLFGSFAMETASHKSDIDIALLTFHRLSETKKYSLLEELENLLNRNVDLIELRFVNTIFQEEILNTAKPIMILDEEGCEMFADFVYCSAMDFREFRKPHIEEIIARGSVYG